MNVFHLSDFHLGKRLCGMSFEEDQRFMLEQIIGLVKTEEPNAVIIAGDVYDRSVPPEEAVKLFDDFLFALSELKVPVLIISGNHDSAERLAYGGRILTRSGIHISVDFNKNNYDEILKPVVLRDNFGEVNFYLLPFVTPYAVRVAREGRPEAQIRTCTDALRAIIEDMNLDESKRNVLIAHQFVTGAERCDSEFSVGGADNIEASVLEPFDYVALGHIHGPQQVGSEKIRYCGTMLKYSFSEERHRKSVTVAELAEKGTLTVSTIPLDSPLHDLRVINDTFANVTANQKSDDYIKVILTDESEIPDAMNKLRDYFPNILQMGYENEQTAAEFDFADEDFDNAAKLSPLDLFAEFYKSQTDSEPDEVQMQIVKDILVELTEVKK